MKKIPRNLKGSKEESIKGFEGRKGREKYYNYVIISKRNGRRRRRENWYWYVKLKIVLFTFLIRKNKLKKGKKTKNRKSKMRSL